MEIDAPASALPAVAPSASARSHDTANYVRLRLTYENFTRNAGDKASVVSSPEARQTFGGQRVAT